MDELVKYIARHLVDHPDAVEVTSREGERGMVIELSVAPEDMGKVIGKQGRIARAMRRIVKAAAAAQDIDCVVEIV